ncbi:MAG: hypothetical protein GX811_09035 [Lentisphaerae bacterium]|nr:hypothetical protein [Lentisphaerota bacterium]
MTTIYGRIGFSLFSFISFLFHFQALQLIVCLSNMNAPGTYASYFLSWLFRPLSGISYKSKFFILLIFGAFLAFVLDTINHGHVLSLALSVSSIPRYLISGLAGINTGLILIKYAVFGIIIASWIGLLTGSFQTMAVAKDWLDFLLYPFLRRFKIQIGPLDLTPLLAILALDFLYKAIKMLLFLTIKLL